MFEVSVREVTGENWEAALALSVWPEQREFVPAVARSLAKCHIKPDGKTYEPFAVYLADEMVGFYTLSYDPADSTKCYLGGFLIDRAHQRRGLGRAALAEYLDALARRFPACEEVYLTVHSDNHAAEALYRRAGFERLGFQVDGENAMRLRLKRARAGV